MTILEKINHFQKVWEAALPHLPAPAPQDAARWCNYPVATVESAILRTAKRFSVGKVAANFDPHQAYRYVTGTARSISQRLAVLVSSQKEFVA